MFFVNALTELWRAIYVCDNNSLATGNTWLCDYRFETTTKITYRESFTSNSKAFDPYVHYDSITITAIQELFIILLEILNKRFL